MDATGCSGEAKLILYHPARTYRRGNNGNRDREMSTLVAIVGKFSQRRAKHIERVFTNLLMILSIHTDNLGNSRRRMCTMAPGVVYVSCFVLVVKLHHAASARWHASDTEKCQVSGVEKSEM